MAVPSGGRLWPPNRRTVRLAAILGLVWWLALSTLFLLNEDWPMVVRVVTISVLAWLFVAYVWILDRMARRREVARE